MHACMHVCMYGCMYVCMFVCIQYDDTCMDACMYVCMYVCMHACMQVTPWPYTWKLTVTRRRVAISRYVYTKLNCLYNDVKFILLNHCLSVRIWQRKLVKQYETYEYYNRYNVYFLSTDNMNFKICASILLVIGGVSYCSGEEDYEHITDSKECDGIAPIYEWQNMAKGINAKSTELSSKKLQASVKSNAF